MAKKEKGYRGIEELKPPQELRDKRNYKHQLQRHKHHSKIANNYAQSIERGDNTLVPEIVYPSKIGWKPTSKEEEDQLANDLVLWAYKHDSIYIADFPLSLGMAPHRFEAIGKTNEYFKECFSIAKGLIASRIFKGAFYGLIGDKEIISITALKYLPVLDEKYEEVINKKAALQAAASEQVRQGFTVVEIPSFKE